MSKQSFLSIPLRVFVGLVKGALSDICNKYFQFPYGYLRPLAAQASLLSTAHFQFPYGYLLGFPGFFGSLGITLGFSFNSLTGICVSLSRGAGRKNHHLSIPLRVFAPAPPRRWGRPAYELSIPLRVFEIAIVGMVADRDPSVLTFNSLTGICALIVLSCVVCCLCGSLFSPLVLCCRFVVCPGWAI